MTKQDIKEKLEQKNINELMDKFLINLFKNYNFCLFHEIKNVKMKQFQLIEFKSLINDLNFNELEKINNNLQEIYACIDPSIIKRKNVKYTIVLQNFIDCLNKLIYINKIDCLDKLLTIKKDTKDTILGIISDHNSLLELLAYHKKELIKEFNLKNKSFPNSTFSNSALELVKKIELLNFSNTIENKYEIKKYNLILKILY